MRALKQILCNHRWEFVAKNTIVNEVLEQCTKCKVYNVRHRGINAEYKTKDFPINKGWEARIELQKPRRYGLSYKNLFIGDFSEDDKNKTYINESLESNTIKFTDDGFTIKFENGVELIHVANGIVIRVAQGKETPMKPDRLDGFQCRRCSGRLARQTDLVRQKYCHHCGQKLNWGD